MISCSDFSSEMGLLIWWSCWNKSALPKRYHSLARCAAQILGDVDNCLMGGALSAPQMQSFEFFLLCVAACSLLCILVTK